jgi:hypothetical protein
MDNVVVLSFVFCFCVKIILRGPGSANKLWVRLGKEKGIIIFCNDKIIN